MRDLWRKTMKRKCREISEDVPYLKTITVVCPDGIERRAQVTSIVDGKPKVSVRVGKDNRRYLGRVEDGNKFVPEYGKNGNIFRWNGIDNLELEENSEDQIKELLDDQDDDNTQDPQERMRKQREEQQKKRETDLAIRQAKAGNPNKLAQLLGDKLKNEGQIYVLSGKLKIDEQISNINLAFKTNKARQKWVTENWDNLVDVEEHNFDLKDLRKKCKMQLESSFKSKGFKTVDNAFSELVKETIENPTDYLAAFKDAYNNGILTETTKPYDFALKLIEQHGNPKKWTLRENVATEIYSCNGKVAGPMANSAAKAVIKHLTKVYKSLGY